MKKRITDEQMIGVLKEAEAGMKMAEAMLDNAALKDVVGRKW